VLNKEIAGLSDQRNSLKARWESEKAIVNNIRKEKENIDRLKFESRTRRESGRLWQGGRNPVWKNRGGREKTEQVPGPNEGECRVKIPF